MAIAAWIREHTARSREKFRTQVVQEMEQNLRAEVLQAVQETALREGIDRLDYIKYRYRGWAREFAAEVIANYRRGYEDGSQGKPPRPPTGDAPIKEKGASPMPMSATAVSHIAICVRDLDESLNFYCGILGMSIVSDVIQDTTTGGLPNVYAHPRAIRRQVRLAYADGAKPTLTMTSHPGEAPDGAPIKLDQVGISHLSFTVPDPKALAKSLAARGVPLAAPLDVWTNADGKVSSFYVYDPDGILVQFDAGG